MAPMTLHPDSLAVHAGRDDLADLGVHALPLDFSSTNPLPGIDVGGLSYEVLATGRPPVRGRVARLRAPLESDRRPIRGGARRLEHAEEAVAFSSGMAAMTAVPARRRSRERQAAHRRGASALRRHRPPARHRDCSASRRPTADPTRSPPRSGPTRRSSILETPANPTLELVDIRAVVAAAATCPCSSTTRSPRPFCSSPLDLGAAHLAPQRDEVPRWTRRCRGRRHRVRCQDRGALRRTRAITGAILHPLAAYLLHRGLATLPVRVRAQQETARVRRRVALAHPDVERVHFPGFPDCDPEGSSAHSSPAPAR